MKSIDYKVEVWRRLVFKDEMNTKELIKAAKEREFHEIMQSEHYIEDETLYETEEHVSSKKDLTTEVLVNNFNETVWDDS